MKRLTRAGSALAATAASIAMAATTAQAAPAQANQTTIATTIPAASVTPTPGVETVAAVPMANLPLYKTVPPGEETDHYSQGPDGSTIVVRTFSGEAAAQIAATQYQNFNYTYDFDSNLQGRTMQTTDGTFCNVVDTINPVGAFYSVLYLQLWKNGGSEVSPQVYVTQPGTGWCWNGNATYTNYHYTYVHPIGYYGYYINGTGHSYG